MNKILCLGLVGIFLFTACEHSERRESAEQTKQERYDVTDVANEPMIEEDLFLISEPNASSRYFDDALASFNERHPSEAADNLDLGIRSLMTEGTALQGQASRRLKATVDRLEDFSSRLREQTVTDPAKLEDIMAEAQFAIANEYVIDLMTVTQFDPLPDFYPLSLDAATQAVAGAEKHLRGERKQAARQAVKEARAMHERIASGPKPTSAELKQQRADMAGLVKRGKS